MAITLSILNGFLKPFHYWKEKKVSNRIYITFLTIPLVCCRTKLRKLEDQVLAYMEENGNENVSCIDV